MNNDHLQNLLVSFHQLADAAEHVMNRFPKPKRTDTILEELRWALTRAQLVLSDYRVVIRAGDDETKIRARKGQKLISGRR